MRDHNGNLYYSNPEPDDQLFNERGIQEILNLLAWYLNKNIILSNFDEKTINQRCYQFQLFLTDFITQSFHAFSISPANLNSSLQCVGDAVHITLGFSIRLVMFGFF